MEIICKPLIKYCTKLQGEENLNNFWTNLNACCRIVLGWMRWKNSVKYIRGGFKKEWRQNWNSYTAQETLQRKERDWSKIWNKLLFLNTINIKINSVRNSKLSRKNILHSTFVLRQYKKFPHWLLSCTFHHDVVRGERTKFDSQCWYNFRSSFQR